MLKIAWLSTSTRKPGDSRTADTSTESLVSFATIRAMSREDTVPASAAHAATVSSTHPFQPTP
jgi:hypothetical protein